MAPVVPVADQGGECDHLSHGTLIQDRIDLSAVGTPTGESTKHQVQKQMIVAVARAHNLYKDKKDHDAQEIQNVTKQGTRSAWNTTVRG